MDELNEINLEAINRSELIDRAQQDEIDDFFLTLGRIFNDLKGLIVFYRLSEEKYIVQKDEGATFKNGELGGLKLQIHLLMIGLIKESIRFVSKKESVINSIRFKLLEKGIDQQNLRPWTSICKVAFSRFEKTGDSFLSKITQVRNDVSYHYDDNDIMRSWFIEKFFKEDKNETNENCYYVNNFQMKSSRFFYCDAILQKYLTDQMVLGGTDHFKELFDFVGRFNESILFLMDAYINSKKKKMK